MRTELEHPLGLGEDGAGGAGLGEREVARVSASPTSTVSQGRP